MRVALIRGGLLRSWELANYELPAGRVDAMASRTVRLGPPADRFEVRRLTSATDFTTRLGPRAFGAVELLAGSPEYLWGLERALRGYDIAHAAELVYPFTQQAVRARAAGACRRVVATVMENIPFKPHPNRLIAARAREVATGVDRFIAVTEGARLHLRCAGIPDERITVLPMGTDLDAFRPHAGERRPGPLRVLSVARLEPAKGVEDVVVAAGLLAQRGCAVEVSMVGAGPLAPRLLEIAGRMGIAERVRVLAVPWEKLPELHRDQDVFVLDSAPTRWWREQFGFAVIEAMASGLPVLVGGSGSLPEVVGRSECLVRPHDPQDLAEALGRLAEDPSLRRREGQLNRERAVGHFDRREIAARLQQIYEQVLSEPAIEARSV
ncbi:MAG: alpha-maltose-phosphate synthase [Thermoleophilaceae bacterium]|jgi:glycosyltransferase involved in cell wall biosynthesis|nr:alpha-maltose-phosphate synthase [Thermoleophilaceae bacterium]